jgi:hypothetical protein
MGDLPAAVPEEGIVKSYWQQLGEKLGAYAEPLAIVLLDLMARNVNGSQRLTFGWARHVVKRVYLEHETEIRPAETEHSLLTG